MSNTSEDRRKRDDINIKDKALLARDRLLDPECSDLEFARKHNIQKAVLTKIQNRINFDEGTAVGELMSRVLVKDNELIDRHIISSPIQTETGGRPGIFFDVNPAIFLEERL